LITRVKAAVDDEAMAMDSAKSKVAVTYDAAADHYDDEPVHRAAR
jgi:hypothetical protein